MLRRIQAKLIKTFHSIFYFLVYMTHFLLFIWFLRIKVFGKENIPKRGRYIIAANHQNFYDGFLIAFSVGPLKRISFVIAKRILRLKGHRILAKLIGSVIIGSSIEEYQGALKKLNNLLSHGGAVCIFPEGDVSKSPIPRKFKGGVAKLSLDSRTKVIPVYIEGTYNLRRLTYLLKRPQILIKIGKSIELYNYSTEFGNNLDEMAEFLRKKIIQVGGLTNEENSINRNNLKNPSTEFKQQKIDLKTQLN